MNKTLELFVFDSNLQGQNCLLQVVVDFPRNLLLMRSCLTLLRRPQFRERIQDILPQLPAQNDHFLLRWLRGELQIVICCLPLTTACSRSECPAAIYPSIHLSSTKYTGKKEKNLTEMLHVQAETAAVCYMTRCGLWECFTWFSRFKNQCLNLQWNATLAFQLRLKLRPWRCCKYPPRKLQKWFVVYASFHHQIFAASFSS